MKKFGQSKSHPKRGESWQVVYMDLMTNVTIFFVILWILAQAQEKIVNRNTGTETPRMVTLPGDVLFDAGKARITKDGQAIFEKLFQDEQGAVLNFDTDGLTKRLLVIHGHTDNDGKKTENLELGYRRAVAAYKEVTRYNKDFPDHVVICTHADNTPEKEIPSLTGKLTTLQRESLKTAKAKNRRITIEDKIVQRSKEL